MRPVRSLALLVLAASPFLSACDSLQQDDTPSAVLFRSDASLSTRLIRSTAAPEAIAGKTGALTVEVVGKVEPMSVAGHRTFANGIQYVGGKVFVTYITPGNEFGGGVDILNVDDPMSAASAKSSSIDVMDISGVAIDGNKLYVSGSVKVGTATGVGTIKPDNGAFLLQTSVSDMEKTDKMVNLASGDVTDVSFGNGVVYATSGATGNVYTLNSALNILSAWRADGLRSVLPTPEGIYALGSTGLHVRAHKTKGDFSRVGEVAPLIDRGLARLSYADGRLYVPLNRGGLSVINTATNTEITQVSGGTFNAVAAYKNYVFVANSDGGLVVYEWNAAKTTLTDIHRLNLDGLEANHLTMAGDYLFVAAADGGVRVLKLNG